MSYFNNLDLPNILWLIGMVLCLGASALVNSTMSKYKKIKSSSGLTGGEAARQILNSEGLYHVQVVCLKYDSGDHYNPRTQTVCLSDSNFHKNSVTAVSVAAHECGHAIQHDKEYALLNFRSALVPVANIGSRLSFPLIMLGVILGGNPTLIQFGIGAFSLTFLFQLVTLPVEFNASARAVEKMNQYGLLNSLEMEGSKKVLTAAALTYVAAAATSFLQLLRLILIFGGGRRSS